MSQRSTAQHYHTDTPFCTIRKSHVTWNLAVPGPHSEEIRRCILLFLCTLDRTGPVVLGRAPACKGARAYGVVRLTNLIRPGKLLSGQWSGWELAWWTLGLFLSPAALLSLSLSLSLSFFLSSSTCRLIRFEFLVLVLGLGHTFYSPIFAFRCLLVKMIFCSSVLLCALIKSSFSSAAEGHKTNQWSWD